MSDVDNLEALLINALQDLHDAKRALVERLPNIADHASDDALKRLLDEDAAQNATGQRQIATLITRRDAAIEGAPNIWLQAIMNDAERDIKTVESGELLDIALVGAIRKGKQSECVSYDTAIALAKALGGEDAPTLEAIRDAAAATDASLSDILLRLTS